MIFYSPDSLKALFVQTDMNYTVGKQSSVHVCVCMCVCVVCVFYLCVCLCVVCVY